MVEVIDIAASVEVNHILWTRDSDSSCLPFVLTLLLDRTPVHYLPSNFSILIAQSGASLPPSLPSLMPVPLTSNRI